MSLDAAFRNAVYTASLAGGPHHIVVDQHDLVLDRLMAEHRMASAARLTAANPGAKTELSSEANAALNAKLAADLDRFGVTHLPCRSAGPNGEWPEEGFLALGLSRAQAELLARAYGQAGYLWMEAGEPVTLVML